MHNIDRFTIENESWANRAFLIHARTEGRQERLATKGQKRKALTAINVTKKSQMDFRVGLLWQTKRMQWSANQTLMTTSAEQRL